VSIKKQRAMAKSPESRSSEPTYTPMEDIDVPEIAVPPLKFIIVVH